MELTQQFPDYKQRREAEDLLTKLFEIHAEATSWETQEAINKLREFCPEATPQVVIDSCKESGVDEYWEVPLFSGMYLYPLLGKMDARTLLAYMRPIFRLARET